MKVPSPPRRKKVSVDRDDYSRRHEESNPTIKHKRSQSPEPSSSDRGRRSANQKGRYDKHHKRSRHSSSRRDKMSNSHDQSSDGRSSSDRGHHHRHHRNTHEHDRWSPR